MGESCCIVDQFCTAPANVERPNARGVCFACGRPVCSMCSTMRKYHDFGRVRLCNECQIDLDGNDGRVMRRLYHLAGYKDA